MKKFLLPVALLVVTAPASAGVAGFFSGLGASESNFTLELREATALFKENCALTGRRMSNSEVELVEATGDGKKRGHTKASCESMQKLIQSIIEKQRKCIEKAE